MTDENREYFAAIEAVRNGADRLREGYFDNAAEALQVAAALFLSANQSPTRAAGDELAGIPIEENQLLVARTGHRLLESVGKMLTAAIGSGHDMPPQALLLRAVIEATVRQGQKCGLGDPAQASGTATEG